MKLTILSEEDALTYTPNNKEKTVIIRIHDPGESVSMLQNELLFDDELFVFFHDIHGENKNLPNYIKFMSTLDAKRILEFAHRNRYADVMVIHCHAGISRSPAVGLGIAWFLHSTDMEESIFLSDRYLPNFYALNVFANILKVEDKKERIVKEYEKRIKDGAKTNDFFL